MDKTLFVRLPEAAGQPPAKYEVDILVPVRARFTAFGGPS